MANKTILWIIKEIFTDAGFKASCVAALFYCTIALIWSVWNENEKRKNYNLVRLRGYGDTISPYFDNNPAFKIFTYSEDTFVPTDYSSMSYDLAAIPEQFGNYYTFTSAYSMQGILDTVLTELFPELATDASKQALYRGYYYSGHDSASPITDKNWPVYWCGIGKMAEQDIIDCVNGY